MSLTKENYKERLIDEKIEKYLRIFGAVSIEGPRWCGKTWTSLNHAESVTFMSEINNRQLAKINPRNIFQNERPQLIDEWQVVPEIWDSVRNECDKDHNKGKFILTGSSTLKRKEIVKRIYHSGAGRIVRVKMHTMSLYESGDSNGNVSIMDMYDNKDFSMGIKEVELREIADLIIRGGWPESLDYSKDEYIEIPKNYINGILDFDLLDNEKVRNRRKMEMLLKSLSRNESTVASNRLLIKDIEDNETEKDKLTSGITTLEDYLDFLDRLYIIDNQEAYSQNYRSPNRVGKSSKRHLTDPSLACACLNLNEDMLLDDLKTFGFLFKSLVERDLRIYMEYLGGNIYYFRDNISGLEVDSILEFENGDYAAVEIKLGFNEVEKATETLQKFYDNTIKKPKFMCIIVGDCPSAYKDPKTGIYVVPITELKP